MAIKFLLDNCFICIIAYDRGSFNKQTLPTHTYNKTMPFILITSIRGMPKQKQIDGYIGLLTE